MDRLVFQNEKNNLSIENGQLCFSKFPTDPVSSVLVETCLSDNLPNTPRRPSCESANASYDRNYYLSYKRCSDH
jgi:hypothetical protein